MVGERPPLPSSLQPLPASLQEIYPMQSPNAPRSGSSHFGAPVEMPFSEYGAPVHDSARRAQMLSHLLTATATPSRRLLTFASESESLSAKHGRMAPGPQSTIGFRLVGTSVDEILPWGPAHLSEEIAVHDEILEVDGKPVTALDIADSIVGLDECNSSVELTIQKADASGIRKVRLNRIFRPLLAIAEDLFETLVKVRAALSTSAPEVIPELERALDAVSALQIGNHDNLQAILEKVNDPASRMVRRSF